MKDKLVNLYKSTKKLLEIPEFSVIAYWFQAGAVVYKSTVYLQALKPDTLRTKSFQTESKLLSIFQC